MEIPDKVFFKIGEVSELAGVKPYVLRYWETEFSIVPHKSGSGQRLYRRKDIERILLIKRLLYAEGFTIAGARKYLSRGGRSGVDPLSEADEASKGNEAEQQPEDVLEQALTGDGAEDEAASGTADVAHGGTSGAVEDPVAGVSPSTSSLSGPVPDPGWLESMREELRGLQALIQAAKTLKV